MNISDDPVRGVQGACADAVWHVDDTKTLQIEVNGSTLASRRCDLRHVPRAGLAAVKFDVTLHELSALSSADVLTWRFTLRQHGAMLGKESGWKVAAMDHDGADTYHLCLEPAAA